jgi:hypothetical protein
MANLKQPSAALNLNLNRGVHKAIEGDKLKVEEA